MTAIPVGKMGVVMLVNGYLLSNECRPLLILWIPKSDSVFVTDGKLIGVIGRLFNV